MASPLIDTKHLDAEIPTTRWSLVRAMGGDATSRRSAMESFAQDYWPAIYAFARKKGNSPHEAEDLTQSFLIHLMDRDRFDGLAEENGRFRSWLLACLHNFLRSNWRDQDRQKRGGKLTHLSIERDLGEAWLEQSETDELSPDVVFDRRWAAALLARAVAELVRSYERDGKVDLARVLVPMITGADERQGYAEASGQLGITEANARVAAFRMRKRLRTLVREEVAATVLSPDEVDAELAELFVLFESKPRVQAP
jgi:RNA polymerase sigma factor (sigma-70 family)